MWKHQNIIHLKDETRLAMKKKYIMAIFCMNSGISEWIFYIQVSMTHPVEDTPGDVDSGEIIGLRYIVVCLKWEEELWNKLTIW